MTVRVLVVDDDPLVRAGIRAILGSDPRISAEAEAADGHEAVRVALQRRPDVVLMDVRMPRRDGLSAAADLLARPRPPAVVMLTTFGERQYVDAAIAAGVSGFLLKTGDPHALVAAVHSVAAGGSCLDPGLTRELLAQVRGSWADRAPLPPDLTEREREVLALLSLGLTNAEIAGRLHLTEGTVKGYVSAVLTRLGVRNRVEAAILGHRAR